jgi:hypothetical protein
MARDILPFVADTPVARRHENEVPNVLRLLIDEFFYLRLLSERYEPTI